MPIGTAPDNDEPSREVMRYRAIRRLAQRRGIDVNIAGYEAIAAGIRAGLYRQISTAEHGRPIYQITLWEKIVYAVWHPELNCISSFLPHRSWLEHRPGASTIFSGAAA